MAAIGTRVFAGLKGGLASHLLEDNVATAAWGCRFQDGTLEGYPEPTVLGYAPAGTRTLYSWRGQHLLKWGDDVSVVESAAVGSGLLYFTGEDAPRFMEPAVSTVTTWKLGVPAPLTSPLVTVHTEKPTAGRQYDALDKESRFYVFTYVNARGEESAPSAPSGMVTCYDDSWVSVNMPVVSVASGFQPYTHVRVYRTASGSSATEYQYVTQLTFAEAQAGAHTDKVKTENLAPEILETANWDPPPVDLQGLVGLVNGSLAGFRGAEVRFTPAYVGYAFPLDVGYTQRVPDAIVALVPMGSDLAVLTNGRPVIMAGATPDAMQQVRVAEFYPCMSAKSAVLYAGMVVFASQDGLMGLTADGGVQLLTKDMFTRDAWRALNPATMRCVPYERSLLLLTDAGVYVLDLADGTFSLVLETLSAAAYDGFADLLYAVRTDTDELVTWGTGGATNYLWQSKLYLLNGQRGPAAARVIADDYGSLTFNLLVDGNVVHSQTVEAPWVFRLPAVRGKRVQYQLLGSARVRSVVVGSSPRECQ